MSAAEGERPLFCAEEPPACVVLEEGPCARISALTPVLSISSSCFTHLRKQGECRRGPRPPQPNARRSHGSQQDGGCTAQRHAAHSGLRVMNSSRSSVSPIFTSSGLSGSLHCSGMLNLRGRAPGVGEARSGRSPHVAAAVVCAVRHAVSKGNG